MEVGKLASGCGGWCLSREERGGVSGVLVVCRGLEERNRGRAVCLRVGVVGGV